jgi:hypothetical protein
LFTTWHCRQAYAGDTAVAPLHILKELKAIKVTCRMLFEATQVTEALAENCLLGMVQTRAAATGTHQGYSMTLFVLPNLLLQHTPDSLLPKQTSRQLLQIQLGWSWRDSLLGV